MHIYMCIFSDLEFLWLCGAFKGWMMSLTSCEGVDNSYSNCVWLDFGGPVAHFASNKDVFEL